MSESRKFWIQTIIAALGAIGTYIGIYATFFRTPPSPAPVTTDNRIPAKAPVGEPELSTRTKPNTLPLVLISLSPAALFVLLVITMRQQMRSTTVTGAQKLRIEDLERSRSDSDANTLRSLGLLVAKDQALEGSMNDLSKKIEDLGQGHNALLAKSNINWGTEIDIGQNIPGFVYGQLRFFDLIREAGDISEEFERLRETYGRMAVPYRSPFSLWRPAPAAHLRLDNVMKEWDEWAQSLVSHFAHCNIWLMRNNLHFSNNTLAQSVARWGMVNTDMSGEALEDLLKEHGGALVKFLDSHAAFWREEVKRKFSGG